MLKINGLTASTDPGLDAIDDGNGIGWRASGRNRELYGPMGKDSVDFSTNSSGVGQNYGTTGEQSFAFGDLIKAGGYNSINFGYLIETDAVSDFNAGINLKNSGYSNTLLGTGHNVSSIAVTVVGQAAEIIDRQVLDYNATPEKELFVVGNGTIQNNDPNFTVLSRSNALQVHQNGKVLAPSLDISKIEDGEGTILTTKDYVLDKLGLIRINRGEAASLISASELQEGRFYQIDEVNISLYGGTTIITQAISNREFSKNGVGFFYTPQYDNYSIYGQIPDISGQTHLIWGGKVWRILNTEPSYPSPLNDFELEGTYYEIVDYRDLSYYRLSQSEIKYDIDNDVIYYRNDGSNKIEASIEYSNNQMPINKFQWGNVNVRDNNIINSTLFNLNLTTNNINNLNLNNSEVYIIPADGISYYSSNMIFSASYINMDTSYLEIEILANSYINHVNMINSEISGVTMSSAHITDITMNVGTIDNMTIVDAGIENCIFENASQSGIILDGSSQRKLTFKNCNRTEAINLSIVNGSESTFTFEQGIDGWFPEVYKVQLTDDRVVFTQTILINHTRREFTWSKISTGLYQAVIEPELQTDQFILSPSGWAFPIPMSGDGPLNGQYRCWYTGNRIFVASYDSLGDPADVLIKASIEFEYFFYAPKGK